MALRVLIIEARFFLTHKNYDKKMHVLYWAVFVLFEF